MCRRCQDDTENQQNGGSNDPRSTAHAVNERSEEQHSKDFTDQVRIRQASLDGLGHGILVAGNIFHQPFVN